MANESMKMQEGMQENVQEGMQENVQEHEHEKVEQKASRDIRRNVTSKQMFNANLALPLKDAAQQGVQIKMTGFAVTETLDLTSGEMKNVSIVVAQDGTMYSGTSLVMENRIRQFDSLVSDEELKEGIDVQFVQIKAGRGMAASMLWV